MEASNFKPYTREDIPNLRRLLSETQSKIEKLMPLRYHVVNDICSESAAVSFSYKLPGEFIPTVVVLDQELIPFNLSMEAARIVCDSLSHYNRVCTSLKVLIDLLEKD